MESTRHLAAGSARCCPSLAAMFDLEQMSGLAIHPVPGFRLHFVD